MRPIVTRPAVIVPALALLAVIAVVAAISVGSVTIPPRAIGGYLLAGDAGAPGWTTLLSKIRIPRVATAALVGAGLAVAGLLMQTLFANPLADPYILGVSSGAGLGVALVTLGTSTATSTFVAVVGAGRIGVVIAAAIGSAAVLLLILGVMLSSAIGAIVSLLLAFADPARLQRYVVWGLGSYGGVTRGDLIFFTPAVLVGVAIALLLSRSLNAMLLGERYAQSMGVRVGAVRVLAVLATALIAGSVTAYCGPIAFLGIAIPHLARLVAGTSDHRVLMPAAILTGVTVSVLCSVIAQWPGNDAVLPMNVVSALIGAPVVMAVLLRSRRLAAGAV